MRPEPPVFPRVTARLRALGGSRPLAVAAAVTATWAVAFTVPRDFRVGHYVDDAHYAMLAKAIRVNGTYRTLNLPTTPPETKYPPGFPLLLATGWSAERSDAENLDRLRSVNLWLVGAVAGALTLLGSVTLRLHPWGAAGLAVAGLLAPRTAELWTVPLSEPLFLLLVALGLALGGAGRGRAAAACLVAAVYVRTLAAPFLIGLLVMAWRTLPRRQAARLAAGSVAALAPWGIWQLAFGGTVPDAALGMHGSYGRWYLAAVQADPAAVLLRAPLENLFLMLRALGQSFLSVRAGTDLLATATGGAIVFAVARAGRRAPAPVFGLVGYALLVLVWPFPSERFVAAVWPLVLVTAVAAVPRIALGVAAVALLLAIPGLRRDQAVLTHRIRTRIADAELERVRPFVRPATVLATPNPPLHYLHFGVAAVPSRRMRAYRWYRSRSWDEAWGDGRDLRETLATFDATLVVADGAGGEGSPIAELRAACPDLLVPAEPRRADEGPFRVDRTAACPLPPAP